MKAKTIENANKALSQLEDFLAIQNPSRAEIAGIIQAFEFTFELIWKLLKEYAEDQGFAPRSPRQAFQEAFKLGAFNNEALWLDVLSDRNLTVHTYNEPLSEEIHQRIRKHHAAEMRTVLKFVTTQSD